MTRYVPLAAGPHSALRWRKPDSFRFCERDLAVPVIQSELPEVVRHFPLAFVDDAGRPTLVALLGLLPGDNLFVEADGRWSAPYIPAVYRIYPFRLLKIEGIENFTLCFDVDSGLFDETAGEPIFAEGGGLAPAVSEIASLLSYVEGDRLRTIEGCRRLRDADILVPWPIKLQTEAGERTIEGLLRADEGKLASLCDAACGKLREYGGLKIAYAQLLSMGHLQGLAQRQMARLSERQRTAALFAASLKPPQEESEVIQFDWSKLIGEPPGS